MNRMDPNRPDDALEHFRNGYLKHRSGPHDRTTRFPAYAMLFDELADPEELKNLADDPALAAVRAELSALVHRYAAAH